MLFDERDKDVGPYAWRSFISAADGAAMIDVEACQMAILKDEQETNGGASMYPELCLRWLTYTQSTH